VSTPGSTANPGSKSSDFGIEREIRFAVVMYGGVSLAIYINGVSQELLRMVRATARSAPGSNTMLFANKDLSESEKIYREVAQKLDAQVGLENDGELTRTRFVVDILSGTSAGGINGVFLAKALARNQTMEGLKSLWLIEGDLGKLLNDTKAEDYTGDTGFAVQKPEKSLLNSQRMYRKLLEALDQMNQQLAENEADSEKKPSPFVEELDLFVTTTDIEGIPLPIQLADRVVYERRYRNVFHFRYAPDPRPEEDRKDGNDYSRDDFRKRGDPFLAFAARCTSSFPFAFDAMQLDDIRTILSRYPRYAGDDPTGGDQWDKFVKDYLRLGLIDIDLKARGLDTTGNAGETQEADLRKAFRHRSFGDGGYLDNKPFSYATRMLMRRSSTCVVQRKLLYVEPTPDHPELAPRQPGPRPDFAANVRAATLDLPRQETIREDIERIDERNEMIRRIGDFAQYLDEDASLTTLPTPFTHDEFVQNDLSDMMARYGATYGPYHRLKVHEITELLTCLVATAAGHDPSSDAGDAIRELIRVWRNAQYTLLKNREGKKTENEFLVDYDIHYRLRRLNFLRRRINQLAAVGPDKKLDATATNLLKAWIEHARKANASADAPRKGKKDQPVAPHNLDVLQDWLEQSKQVTGLVVTDKIDASKWLKDFRDELNAIKDQLAKPLQRARFTEEQFLNSKTPAFAELRAKINKLKLPWELVEDLLSDNDTIRKKAKDKLLVEDRGLDELDSVAKTLRLLFDNASSFNLKIADAAHADVTRGADAARLCLDHYYQNFLIYDLITYPVQYGTNSGEADVVEVYRVSPEDSRSIMEERAGTVREKLAGRTLMSFGAFLDESWRKNDMLWGRLDGAERLISALLTDDTPERQDLIYHAHLGILKEEILQGNGDAVCRLLSNALAHPHKSASDDQHTIKLLRAILADKALAPYITDERRDYLVTPEKFDRALDPEVALKYISRSTNITGNMLDDLADQYRFKAGRGAATWISRLGTTLWNLIAVAVPQSLGNIFFRHWLGLLYLFSAVMILAGIAFKSVTSLGWQLLGATVALNLVTWLLGDFIAGKHHWFTVARRIGILIVAVLIGCGVFFIASHWPAATLATHPVRSGAIAGTIVIALLAVAEWSRWLKNFLRAPTMTFSYTVLFLLTLAGFALGGILGWIGPKQMAGLEFAGAVNTANDFVAKTTLTTLRAQLAVDFLFIVAYASALAGYCVAGAKLFWRRRQNVAFKLDQKRRIQLARLQKENKLTPEKQKELAAMGSSRLRFLCAVVVAGFVFAGLAWVAGFSDVTENVGLLRFLAEPEPRSEVFPLQVASWAATLKFCLVALTGGYAAVALLFGAWTTIGLRKTSSTWWQRLLRVAFVLISLFAVGFAGHALLRCRPHPENCQPIVSKQQST
jgi:patatin-related protein